MDPPLNLWNRKYDDYIQYYTIYVHYISLLQYYTIWLHDIIPYIVKSFQLHEVKGPPSEKLDERCAEAFNVPRSWRKNRWFLFEWEAENTQKDLACTHMIPFVTFMFGISKETGNEVVLLTTWMWAALQKDLAKFLWFFHAFQTLRHRVPPTQAMSAAMLIHVD